MTTQGMVARFLFQTPENHLIAPNGELARQYKAIADEYKKAGTFPDYVLAEGNSAIVARYKAIAEKHRAVGSIDLVPSYVGSKGREHAIAIYRNGRDVRIIDYVGNLNFHIMDSDIRSGLSLGECWTFELSWQEKNTAF